MSRCFRWRCASVFGIIITNFTLSNNTFNLFTIYLSIVQCTNYNHIAIVFPPLPLLDTHNRLFRRPSAGYNSINPGSFAKWRPAKDVKNRRQTRVQISASEAFTSCFLDIYGAGEDNGGRGTDSPGVRHPNRTNGSPAPTTPQYYIPVYHSHLSAYLAITSELARTHAIYSFSSLYIVVLFHAITCSDSIAQSTCLGWLTPAQLSDCLEVYQFVCESDVKMRAVRTTLDCILVKHNRLLVDVILKTEIWYQGVDRTWDQRQGLHRTGTDVEVLYVPPILQLEDGIRQHPLLPPPVSHTQRYGLRPRAHDKTLPERTSNLVDCNFIIRMLYLNAYWLYIGLCY